MALTVAQKNELATRLVNAQQTGNYGSFNDLVKQLRLTQADLLSNFPAINQAGIDEQITRGAVVPKTAPAAVNYTTGQVAQAIRDSLNAGFTVQQARMGAMTNFGLSSEDFDKALSEVEQGRTTFTDERVAQAIRDSIAQGFTLEQAREGASKNFGVGADQFNRAARLVGDRPDTYRGSAPTFQFPGLLGGREDMPTGAQRFLAQRPGSLLFDVPKVQGGEFTFTPGAFDYEAIRNQQAGAGQVDQMQIEQGQIQPGTAEYIRLTTPTEKQPEAVRVTAPIEKRAEAVTPQRGYSDQQVAQALRESMAQGFSLEQSLQGASQKYGITQDQLNRAVALNQGRNAMPSEEELPVAQETPTAQTTVQAFSTLPSEQRQQVSDYLSAVVPIVAERSLEGGTGWNDLTMLSRQYRVTADELLGFMSPEQKAQFQERFSYQLPNNTRLFNPQTAGITGETGEFTVPQAGYLQQAASLLGTASPEARTSLRQMLYSGATIGDMGGSPILPAQTEAFGTPWWLSQPTTAQAVAALASGNPQEYYRQQAIARAQAPLSETFGDAATRTSFGNIGGYDVTASVDKTPYIEDVNLYGDRAISRLRDMYGMSDAQISGLLNLIPQEVFTQSTGPGRMEVVYPGELGTFMREQAALTAPAAPSVEAAVREGLLAPAIEQPIIETPVSTPVTPVSPVVEAAQSNLLANPTQYSDAQIAQAIIDSLGQGFNMDQIRMGAFNNFGVTPEQFTSASALLPGMGYTIGQGFQ